MVSIKKSGAEIFQRGKIIYIERIRPKFEFGNKGKFVAIDVDTGIFEIAEDELCAADALLQRKPTANIYIHRIGYRAAAEIGGSVSVSGPE